MMAKPAVAIKALRSPTISKDISVTVAIATPITKEIMLIIHSFP